MVDLCCRPTRWMVSGSTVVMMRSMPPLEWIEIALVSSSMKLVDRPSNWMIAWMAEFILMLLT